MTKVITHHSNEIPVLDGNTPLGIHYGSSELEGQVKCNPKGYPTQQDCDGGEPSDQEEQSDEPESPAFRR